MPTLDDLVAELPAKVAVPESIRRRPAIREAGNVVVALALVVGEIVSVAIASTIAPGPEMKDGGGIMLKEPPLLERTRSELPDRIAMRLCADRGRRSGPSERSAGGGWHRF